MLNSFNEITAKTIKKIVFGEKIPIEDYISIGEKYCITIQILYLLTICAILIYSYFAKPIDGAFETSLIIIKIIATPFIALFVWYIGSVLIAGIIVALMSIGLYIMIPIYIILFPFNLIFGNHSLHDTFSSEIFWIEVTFISSLLVIIPFTIVEIIGHESESDDAPTEYATYFVSWPIFILLIYAIRLITMLKKIVIR